MAPLITLTSDFGEGSPYVAAMKAKLLAGCHDATLIDISHSVPAFDVVAAAFVLWAGTRHFEPGAVHLAVVDPGVGGARRAVAFAVKGSWYVGPDNGLFSLILAEAEPEHPIEIARPPGASPTFEGRDLFAPAAGRLAAGTPLEALGLPLSRPLVGLAPGPPSVLWVDGFGNLVTSLKPPVSGLRISGREVRNLARTYAEAPPDAPFLYVGSMGYVEIGLRQARADELLGAKPGTPIEPL